MKFENILLSDFIDFNPRRVLSKGSKAPYIEMAAVPEGNRDISYTFKKEYKGSGSKFKNGDTLFARITPCLENGKTSKVNCLEDSEVAHGSTEFIVLSAKEPYYDEEFIYYLCRWDKFRGYAKSRMEGTSGRQRVDWKVLANSAWQLPPKQDRKRIGHFLKQLDDKIANNYMINAALEELAQNIFKNWFVDFEPVKAKINAIKNGLDPQVAAMCAISGKTEAELRDQSEETLNELAETAKLFPDKLLETDMGFIPEGWETKKLIEFSNLIMGQSPKSVFYNTEKIGLPFHQGVKDYGIRFPKNIIFSTKGNRIAQKGDVLFSVRAPVGRLNVAKDKMILGRGLASISMRSHSNNFLFYLLKERFRNEDSIGDGTIYKAVNKNELENLKFVFPSGMVIDFFNDKAKEIDLIYLNNHYEIIYLEKIKNSLLQRLFSGEIQING